MNKRLHKLVKFGKHVIRGIMRNDVNMQRFTNCYVKCDGDSSGTYFVNTTSHQLSIFIIVFK